MAGISAFRSDQTRGRTHVLQAGDSSNPPRVMVDQAQIVEKLLTEFLQ
jgi:hypothetical protein